MKTYLLVSIASLIILAGCSTSKSTADYDDVYSTSKKKNTTASSDDQTQVTTPDYYEEGAENITGYNPENYETGENVAYEDEPYLTTTETVTTPEGTNYITNNYYEGYGYDDYYDYSYAERIDRFYSPYMGYSYYAPCYTGYYYDPWYWDSYWYMPSFYFGFNWGWGSMYWGYPYYPYYPYNSYWYGYNDGYWNGYWDGYYGYSYNDYYPYYYGHRETRSGSGNSGSGTGRDNPSSIQDVNQYSYLERTTPQLADNTNNGRSSNNSIENGGRTSTNSISSPNVRVADQTGNNSNTGRSSEQNISGIKNEPGNRNSTLSAGGTGITTGSKLSAQNNPQDQNQNRTSSGTTRYSYKKPAGTGESSKVGYKPGQTINNNSSRTSQKYSKPVDRSSSTGNVSSQSQGTVQGNQNRQTYTRPQSNSNNSYSRPSGYNSESQRNSQPSRSFENSYSQPSRSSSNYKPSNNSSRSYSQPSRSSSSGSYSTPSRSGSSGSYSAPSRSSSSSGSSPSRSGGSSSGSGGASRGGRK
jgi:hypothetical protein